MYGTNLLKDDLSLGFEKKGNTGPLFARKNSGAVTGVKGFARMSCARMDVKPINRRRGSLERVHAPCFKAGRDFAWTR